MGPFEWWSADQTVVGAKATGERSDGGDLERLVLVHRRQDRGQAGGDEGFSCSGRTGHEQVVATGGGDFGGVSGIALPEHVGEIDPLSWG